VNPKPLNPTTLKPPQELLEFRCVRPMLTVHAFLESKGCAALLDDPLMAAATAEVVAAGRPRHEVQREIKTKERAREAIARKYRCAGWHGARCAVHITWCASTGAGGMVRMVCKFRCEGRGARKQQPHAPATAGECSAAVAHSL
jgi:Protein of unknown function (DUF2009)